MLRIQSTQKAHNARILASNYSMKDEESELLGDGMEIKISENQVKDSAYIDRRARSQIPEEVRRLTDGRQWSAMSQWV